MTRGTYLITLAVLACFLAATLQSAHSSPINWDKVNLTKEQERTVDMVDGLLNQLLKQLKNSGEQKDYIDKVKDNAGEVGVAEDEENASTVSEEKVEVPGSDAKDNHRIYFPECKK